METNTKDGKGFCSRRTGCGGRERETNRNTCISQYQRTRLKLLDDAGHTERIIQINRRMLQNWRDLPSLPAIGVLLLQAGI